MTTKVRTEGWGWPLSARYSHYFTDSASLCGHWGSSGVTLTVEHVNGPRVCPVCTEKRKALR
jgi:hypothetical protein